MSDDNNRKIIKEEIIPNTDSLYIEYTTTDGKREYFHGLDLRTGATKSDGTQLCREVFVGDVVAVAVDDPELEQTVTFPPVPPKKKSPWHPLKRPWKVGLVLALWSFQKDDTSPDEFQMSILWLHRDYHMMSSSAHKECLQMKRSKYQHPFVVLESKDIQEVPVRHIVPSLFVTLETFSSAQPLKYPDDFVMNAEDNKSKDWTMIRLTCPYRFQDKANTQLEGAETKSAEKYWPAMTDSTSDKGVLEVLQQFWKYPGMPFPTGASFYKHVNQYETTGIRKLEYRQKIEKEIRDGLKVQEDDGGEDEEMQDNSAMQEDDGSDEGEVQKVTAKRPSKSSKQPKKRPPAKTTKKKQAAPSKKKPSKGKAVVTTKAKNPSTAKHVSKAKAQTTRSTKQSTKNKAVAVTKKKAATTATKRITTTAITTTKATTTKGKKRAPPSKPAPKNKKTRQKEAIDGPEVSPVGDSFYLPGDPKKAIIKFYYQFRLKVDTQYWDAKLKKQTAPDTSKEWTLRVGDIVAIMDEGSSPPDNRKNRWRPFTTNWSAAMVMALFENKVNGEYEMSVRWFLRWSELEPNVQDRLKKETPEIAQRLKTEPDRTVVESRWTVDVNASLVLGKLGMGVVEHNDTTTTALLTLQCPYEYMLQEGEEPEEDSDVSSWLVPRDEEWANYFDGYQPWLRATSDKDEDLGHLAKYRAFLKKPKKAKTLLRLETMSISSGSAFSSSLSSRCWNPATWKMPLGPEGHRWSTQDQQGWHGDNVFDPLGSSKVLLKGAKGHPSFWDSVEIPVQLSHYETSIYQRADKALESLQAPKFRVNVGDVVCIARDNEEGFMSEQDSQVFFPFQGNWKIGQVIAIYSSAYENKTSRMRKKAKATETTISKDVFVEVRWLPRFTELSLDWQHNLRREALTGNDKGKQEQRQPLLLPFDVLESDLIEEDLPASNILCSVNLVRKGQGNHLVSLSSGDTRRRRQATALPLPTIRCNVLDLWFWKSNHSVDSLYFPLADDGPDERIAQAYMDRFFRRGCKVSRLLKQYEDLVNVKTYRQAMSAMNTVIRNDAPLQIKDPVELSSGEERSGLRKDCNDRKSPNKQYLESLKTFPRWDLYKDPLCDPSDRPELLWTLRVGDFVAVKGCSETDEPSFPFAVPWTIAQVVTIFKRNEGYHLELRRFGREKAQRSSPRLTSPLGTSQMKDASETSEVYTVELPERATSLEDVDVLGPASLYFPANGAQNSAATSLILRNEPFLPTAACWYSGPHKATGSSSRSSILEEMFERGVQCATQYDDCPLTKERVIQFFRKRCQQELVLQCRSNLPSLHQLALGSPSAGFRQGENSPQRATPVHCQAVGESVATAETLQEARIHLPLKPFHIDRSSKRVYFDKIAVEPAYGNFAIRSSDESRRTHWEVKPGDVIVAHYEQYKSSGPAFFEPNTLETKVKSREEKPNYPFSIPWGVAEIVCIWKNDDERRVSSPGSSPSNPVCCEVRWFYRRNELPSSEKDNGKFVGSSDTLEEIMESDHVDDIEATSLLAPVQLHTMASRQKSSQFDTGMPVLDFFCRRFFSILRRSLIPCGGLDGRITRGMSHSKYIREDAVLRELVGAADDAGARSRAPKNGADADPDAWKDAFAKVIKKLSLTDASKESSESVMIGREREQKQIFSFLQGAICGGSEETGSSMFVAGPPGMGKTACIRAAIAKLQRDQTAGLVPAFRFIALNGMEMRHPFEAYVRLLEAVKGGVRVRKSEEEAAAALEKHFTSTSGQSDEKENVVTVVLLDEIDYLVTQKQTVMYNFFDWPRRSAALCASGQNGRRLVVIGVSNTLNLPERLQPRVQSRIGNKRCYFKSYNVKEIQSILKAKIHQASPDIQVFDEDAIIFAAKKTAAVSGDVRKAFQICRSAAERVLNLDTSTLDQPNRKLLVRIPDVQKVSKEASDSGLSKAVAQSTPFEALLIVSMASLARSTGRENKGFDIEEIMTKMDAVAGALGDDQYTPPPRFEETLFMLNRLAESQIVLLQTPRNASISYRSALAGMGGAWPVASLQVDETNISLALRGTKHAALSQKYLPKAGF